MPPRRAAVPPGADILLQVDWVWRHEFFRRFERMPEHSRIVMAWRNYFSPDVLLEGRGGAVMADPAVAIPLKGPKPKRALKQLTLHAFWRRVSPTPKRRQLTLHDFGF